MHQCLVPHVIALLFLVVHEIITGEERREEMRESWVRVGRRRGENMRVKREEKKKKSVAAMKHNMIDHQRFIV